jgi:hypothetical protein
VEVDWKVTEPLPELFCLIKNKDLILNDGYDSKAGVFRRQSPSPPVPAVAAAVNVPSASPPALAADLDGSAMDIIEDAFPSSRPMVAVQA